MFVSAILCFESDFGNYISDTLEKIYLGHMIYFWSIEFILFYIIFAHFLHMINRFLFFLLVVFVLLFWLFRKKDSLFGCAVQNTDTAVQISDKICSKCVGDTGLVNRLLGMPSAASDLTPDDFLMDKHYFVLSYNKDRAIANWVSWHLDKYCLGAVKRYKGSFITDTTLPKGWYAVRHSDYTRSGFDRGHTCPSSDRTRSVAANKATFVLTNIFPQAPRNNQITWKGLETYERALVEGGKEAYIVAGSYGTGGTGKAGEKDNLKNRVTVLAGTWKVVLVLEEGLEDIQRIDTHTRVIAVDMPNNQALSPRWQDYIVTPQEIEAKTGYHFFTNIKEEIRRVLIRKKDTAATH